MKHGLQQAADLLAQGAPEQAESSVRDVLAVQPDSPFAWMLLSRVLQRQGRMPEMLEAAERAVALRPRNIDARIRLADCRFLAGDVSEALSEVRHAEATADARKGALLRIAGLYERYGLDRDAHRARLKAVEISPNNAEALLAAARSCERQGEFDQAYRLCERSLFQDPKGYRAFALRSRIRRHDLDHNHIDAMMFVLDQLPQNSPDRIHLCQALSHELEDIGHYDEAFSYLEQANLLQQQVPGNPTETYSPDLPIAQDAEMGRNRVFLAALPSAGQELLSTALAMHPELGNLGANRCFELALRMSAPEQAATDYLKRIAGFERQEQVLLDTNPSNPNRMTQILSALPGARIIHLRRSPMDHCYQLFRTAMDPAESWRTDLQRIANHFVAYHQRTTTEPMASSENVLVVDLETLLRNIQGEMTRVFQFLEMDISLIPGNLEDRLEPRIDRLRRTVSLWKSYRRQLGTLHDELEAHKALNWQVSGL